MPDIPHTDLPPANVLVEGCLHIVHKALDGHMSLLQILSKAHTPDSAWRLAKAIQERDTAPAGAVLVVYVRSGGVVEPIADPLESGPAAKSLTPDLPSPPPKLAAHVRELAAQLLPTMLGRHHAQHDAAKAAIAAAEAFYEEVGDPCP